MAKIRGTHSSPGLYTEFNDVSYAVNSLGITSAGLVGETLKGAAFEPIPIKNWAEYETYFGGTSAEKFKDSNYPKYELPYIAKTYLTASDKLYVCRVLGLSGYNAGPAWLITATNTNKVVAVLRSRGSYNKYGAVDRCSSATTAYDTIEFDCDEVSIEPYVGSHITLGCEGSTASTSEDTNIVCNASNLGRFTITCKKGGVEIGKYSVSLNAGSKDYIYNILGSKATEGSAPVFVEELYDIMLQELVDTTTSGEVFISTDVIKVPELKMTLASDPVLDFVKIPNKKLSRKNLGQTFLADNDVCCNTDNFYSYSANNNTVDISSSPSTMVIGKIYKVVSFTNSKGVKEYTYIPTGAQVTNKVNDTVSVVKVLSYDRYFHLDTTTTGSGSSAVESSIVVPATSMSDYREEFRCATTPWIVSEIKGDAKNLEVKKLFRFHTISDGNTANELVKISIVNIRPDEGLFDVQVRDFYDTDSSPVILEYFKNCSMMPGDSKYVGLKIGTVDGTYAVNSKYVMLEIIDNDMTRNCVPCGFLGYPVRDYASCGVSGVTAPSFAYNIDFDLNEKDKRQYFGLSDIKGIDVDILNYKGKDAYLSEYGNGFTPAFHLDATLNPSIKDSLNITVTVDGEPLSSAIEWMAVSPNASNDYDEYPVIGSEAQMVGTLYEKVSRRKFTVCPFGGFDGWDVYRRSRTNTDEYKASRYRGNISNGIVSTFTKLNNPEALGLDAGAITSDYYAYLAGINQFEIPEKYVINLFATPGIDYVNHNSLVNEALDMIEEKRGDAFYVITTPDKPFGATDARDEMYTSSEAADNLDDSGIDSYYAATYYPWVKYFDADNSMYINLPATKDALRNMANVDNKKFPWFAPAGNERGDVECTKMHFFAKIDDEDNVYSNRINPLKTFSEDGVKIWGNKTMYTGDTPMNRINVVRLMLYMRKLITQVSTKLIFEPNDTTLKSEFESLINPILSQIKNDRGITDFRVVVSQTPEQMDAHELSAVIFCKPLPTLEYMEISFNITPQGVSFDEI